MRRGNSSTSWLPSVHPSNVRGERRAKRVRSSAWFDADRILHRASPAQPMDGPWGAQARHVTAEFFDHGLPPPGSGHTFSNASRHASMSIGMRGAGTFRYPSGEATISEATSEHRSKSK